MQLKISSDVRDALDSNAAIVALESTVIAHGLPYPQNLETANKLESIVRSAGAIPATIAVFDGEFCVGLDAAQIEHLATASDVRKISRRDLAVSAAKKLTCATTVATTAFIADRAGIKVFATGGIGGVHRGYSADVSADLPELARTPMVIVCSGPKIVLDIAATREWLETFGITVLGWKCDEMPSFYAIESGLPVDERVDSPAEVAAIAVARDELGLTNAILVTVPVSAQFAIDRDRLETIVTDATVAAQKSGISGKAMTPFLLDRMSQATGGETLRTNIALLENNARVAAEIAGSMIKYEERGVNRPS
jgi:pseudouridine-5'-phosphate glycosidase